MDVAQCFFLEIFVRSVHCNVTPIDFMSNLFLLLFLANRLNYTSERFAISMFWLNFYQFAYIGQLRFFISLYPLLFSIALEQNVILSQEFLVMFCIPNESISELNVNR